MPETSPSSPSRGVTLKDIAEACGVSHSTVSRALHAHPRIPPATRERIHRVAKDLGYHPDARMEELMAQVRKGRQLEYQGTLALIFLSGYPQYRHLSGKIEEYVRGICQRAEQLGYGLDEIWMEAQDLTESRVDRVLRGRGISGALLIKPNPDKALRVAFNWAQCAWAVVGFSLPEPALHTATPDWAGDARHAVAQMREKGHERIGLVYQLERDPVMGNAWLAGYASEMLAHGTNPLVFRTAENGFGGMKEWLESARPTAMLVHSAVAEEELTSISPEVEVVTLNMGVVHKPLTGLITSCYETGISAVDVVSGQLRRGERGIPQFQKTIRTRGRWVEGEK